MAGAQSKGVFDHILDTLYIPGNTNRSKEEWPAFLRFPVFKLEDSPTFKRLSALIWADLLSGFALYVMMNYLTNVWNLSTTHAAGIINIFNGITPALAIALSVFAGTVLGDFYMLVFSSIAYSIGLGLLSLSTPPFFGPCSQYKEECIGHIQKVLFFTALPLIAVGQAGQDASLESFMDLQRAGAEARVEAEELTKRLAEALVEALAQARAEAQSQALAQARTQAEAEARDEATYEALITEAENQAHVFEDQHEAEARVKDEARAKDLAKALVQADAEDEAAYESLTEAEKRAVYVAQREAKDQHKDLIETRAIARVPEKLISLKVALMMVVFVIICGGIALPYIKPWSVRFGIPAICASTATLLFLTGYSKYKYSMPEWNPFTIALSVFVAAAAKYFQQVTNFEVTYKDKQATDEQRTNDTVQTTNTLRWLDRASTKFPDQAMLKSWTLCSVSEVEDIKAGIRMIPLLLTFIVTGLTLSLGNTYFLEQANHMDRTLGSIKIQIPIFLVFYTSSSIVSQYIYNALLVAHKQIPKRYISPIGIAIGMVLSVLCCITAAIVETQRLRVIRNHGLLDKPNERIPMSVFILLPQFLLLGAVNGFANFCIKRLLTYQLRASTFKYPVYFQRFVLGLGSIASVLWVYVVGKVSEINNSPNWFQHTLKRSRLDRYYWTLTGLSAVNLVIYLIVASFYRYDDDEIPEDGLYSFY